MFTFLTKAFNVKNLATNRLRFLSNPISFRGNVNDEPEWCQTVHGEWVPYPKGRRDRLGDLPVIEHGDKAVSLGLDAPGTETDNTIRLYNNAKRYYLGRRAGLLKDYMGKWVAVGSGGQMFLADTEKEVRSVAEVLFPINQDQYYADCIGKEILCAVYMD